MGVSIEGVGLIHDEHIVSQMGVSKNNGTPKSSILIGFGITNHPFWGTPIFGNTQIFVVLILLGGLWMLTMMWMDFPDLWR